MFCSNCGKADQTSNTYCRSCGQFLRTASSGPIAAFGGITPRENVNSINLLSVIATIASLVTVILMYLTAFNEPVILYLAAAILICNAGWHISNLIVGLKLRRRLGLTAADNDEVVNRQEELPAAETRELLPVGDAASPLPLSVTEETTKNLKDKVRR